MNAGAVGSALIFVALVVLSLVGAGFEIFSHDVSYYLYVSREVLTGALPFRDFIDPNLPTIIYLGVPVAWLSEGLGVEVWTGFRWFVLGLQLVALGLCARLVRGGVAPGDPVLQWAVMTGLLTATCLVPMGLVFVDGSHFGQREHLALLFVTPYVLWHAIRVAGESLPRGWALAVVSFASVGIAIKPHFLLFWLLLEVTTGRREWREGRFPVEAWWPPLAFGLYFATLLVALPDFPAMIGNTWRLYGAYRASDPLDLLSRSPVVFPAAIWLLYRLLPVAPALGPLRSTQARAGGGGGGGGAGPSWRGGSWASCSFVGFPITFCRLSPARSRWRS